ncbi:MAG TPA: uridine kinase [Propionicimonas sp.]|nr:uridine kinase [Propionicimonas sp.]HRA05475.1 uridine kinase [Propionicimonas sp.]
MSGTGPVRLVLIAGPSGSGKSRLAHAAGVPSLRLDDYYFDADHPDLPKTDYGIIDWDDPRCWDAAGAVAGLQELLATGRLVAPAYSISESRRVGSHEVLLGNSACLTAEGIFAIEFLAHCRAAGLDPEAIYLDRPALVVFWLRLRRDLAKKRKAPHILFQRGIALCRAQSTLKRTAIAAGFTPMSMSGGIAALTRR